MKVIRVLNKTAVLAEDFHENKKVLIGILLGEQCVCGEFMPKKLLDQAVILSEEDRETYLKLTESIPEKYFETVFKILKLAEIKLYMKCNSHVYSTLTDHIFFAVKRMKKNILFLDNNNWNVKKIYPEEFQLAKEALNIIKEDLGEDLPSKEAVFLVFHFVNAAQGVTSADVFQMADIIQNVMKIIKFYYGREPRIGMPRYARFIGYLQISFRSMAEKKVSFIGDQFLQQQAREKYAWEMKCIDRIGKYLQKEFGSPYPNEEKMHLAVYLKRMMEEE